MVQRVSNGRLRGHRGPRRRRAGAGRARPARLQHRRPARQGGVGSQGAGARGADRLRPGAAGAPHHRQSRARRPAQGRQPLRPADRARADGRDRRDPARRASPASPCWANSGSTARSPPVAGVLPAAIGANARGEGLICPAACGPEAAWASPEIEIVAARSLIQLANHFKGTQVLTRPQPKIREIAELQARSRRHQGPGERQARARSRRRRRPQSADGRPARRRQVDAGRTAALDPAAADAGRTARSVDDRLGRRRDRRRRAHQPAAVPRAASFRLDAGAGRRRLARAAGRNFAGA